MTSSTAQKIGIASVATPVVGPRCMKVYLPCRRPSSKRWVHAARCRLRRPDLGPRVHARVPRRTPRSSGIPLVGMLPRRSGVVA